MLSSRSCVYGRQIYVSKFLRIFPRNPLHHAPICQAHHERRDLDADFIQALDEVSSKTLKVILENDDTAAERLHQELTETQSYLIQEQDTESVTFITILQALLKHSILEEVSGLKGPYLRAYNRLFNAIQESGWTFSNNKEASSSSNYYQSQEREETMRTTEDNDQNYYTILGVTSSIQQEDLKGAFRKLALKWHPDVNKDPQAGHTFVKIRKAYDVLSNPKSRALYDRYGAEGMEKMRGSHDGDGNADRFWSEFKPFKKETRKSKARAAAMDRDSTNDEQMEPQAGDLVEYPLSKLIKMELQDGREKGVGLLVGRNKDRGDAKKLPKDLLGMCEIEPLRQQETNSTKWIPDEIGCSAFCDISQLKKIPFHSYDNRIDVWEFDTELSDGCGGPEIVEEIML